LKQTRTLADENYFGGLRVNVLDVNSTLSVADLDLK